MDITTPATVGPLHRAMHWVADSIGHQMTDEAPVWLHQALHLVLLGGPLAMLALVVATIAIVLRRRVRRGHETATPPPEVEGFAPGVYRYILDHSRRDQIALMALGLASMPVLYATLELPKIIVNNAIDATQFPVEVGGFAFEQLGYLFALCALYLLAVLVNGSMKFSLNVYKGRVGERLLRRLRLTIYRRWREGAGSDRRAEVIPLVAQEVEPIGGFAAEAFALPVFQGGTFATILVFMFMQDPVLGAAAVTLLPVQLALIPRLQRRVNRLARARVAEVRGLCGELGAQAAAGEGDSSAVCASLKRIETIRLDIHRAKFFMKAVNNFLTAMTPFFFYAIGGWLVIEGRLSLGALVAVLAAYKDFSAPLRELFRHYQSAEDVRVRYSEMLRHLAGRPLREERARRAVSALRPAFRPIRLET